MPLIVFEGMDGAGTTTQSKKLVETMREKHPDQTWIWTCQPTKGPVGKFVRDVFEGRTEYTSLPDARVMMYLFQADKEEHYQIVRQWLSEGAYVVCDRYWYSGYVYQAASCKTAGERDQIRRDIAMLGLGAPMPKLVFYLKVSAEVGYERGGKKSEARDLYTKLDYLRVIGQYYDEMFDGFRLATTVDTTSQDEQTVAEEVLSRTERALFNVG